MFFTYPLMVGIQLVSARIGLVTGRGLAENMRLFYPKYVTWPLVILLLAANTINIAADLAAMADAVKLVVGGPRHLYAVGFGMSCLLLQIFIPIRTLCSRFKMAHTFFICLCRDCLRISCGMEYGD